jgi:hypothetical protein
MNIASKYDPHQAPPAPDAGSCPDLRDEPTLSLSSKTEPERPQDELTAGVSHPDIEWRYAL